MATKEMYIEGFWDTVPEFSKLVFENSDYMTVFLTDGKRISVPLSKFPSIRKPNIYYLFGSSLISI